MSEQNPRKFCRICHSRRRRKQLLSPCGCRGSLSHVHLKCLIDWVKVSKRLHCGVCQSPYNCPQLTTRRHSFKEFPHLLFKLFEREFMELKLNVVIGVLMTLVFLNPYLWNVVFSNCDQISLFDKYSFIYSVIHFLLLLMSLKIFIFSENIPNNTLLVTKEIYLVYLVHVFHSVINLKGYLHHFQYLRIPYIIIKESGMCGTGVYIEIISKNKKKSKLICILK